MKKIIIALLIAILGGTFTFSTFAEFIPEEPIVKSIKSPDSIKFHIIDCENIKTISESTTVEPEEAEGGLYSLDDMKLIALVTMAEAEGECEEGKRLVIDTILNRVDSIYFPNTVHDVIYQENQFACMWNGRVERCEVTEYILKIVAEEIESRTNNECVFFNSGEYSKYGEPMFNVENHYFSSYN